MNKWKVERQNESQKKFVTKEAKVFLSILGAVAVIFTALVFVFALIPEGYFSGDKEAFGGSFGFASKLAVVGSVAFQKIDSPYASSSTDGPGMANGMVIAGSVHVQRHITVNIVNSLSSGGGS